MLKDVAGNALNTASASAIADDTALAVNTAGAYAAWQAINSAIGQALADDHDHDGVANGIEWFLNGSNNSPGNTALPGVTTNSGALSVTWTKGSGFTGVYGTDYWVETSAGLTEKWSAETLGGTVTLTGNDVKYTFPAGTKKFARLKVTGP